ncbi:capsid cement protein [Nocardia cerradoensis]|uniref:capsid cement protein n=1 Tax=Nocardia cerradoensis TaxID=85688 RepID=UPI001CB9AAD8|nr:capsid cement protein [Nocardia cerradoensis]
MPLFDPGDQIPMVTGAPVTAGQVLYVSADNTVSATATAVVPIGIAGQDDPVGGATIMVKRRGVWVLAASGAIAAGALVIPAAAGAVATIASDTNYGHVVGSALAAAANNKVTVALRLA